jgi:hypothetical protein
MGQWLDCVIVDLEHRPINLGGTGPYHTAKSRHGF